jgi:hypothetical protein
MGDEGGLGTVCEARKQFQSICLSLQTSLGCSQMLQEILPPMKEDSY